MSYAPPVRRIDRGRGHHYADADGNRVPGVTTIIGNGVPKPALINWAANTTAGYAVDHWDELGDQPPSVRLSTLQKARYADRDQAANRGTRVHQLAEHLAAGDTVDVPDELAGHVASYIKFLDDFDVQPVLSEFVVVSHRHGYAGTADLIADLAMPDQTRWLLDIKTSRSGVFGETALQLAGYRYADYYVAADGTERPIPEVRRCGAVHVRADGYDLIPVEAGPAEHRVLLYAAQIAAFVDTARDLIGDAVLPPQLQEPT